MYIIHRPGPLLRQPALGSQSLKQFERPPDTRFEWRLWDAGHLCPELRIVHLVSDGHFRTLGRDETASARTKAFERIDEIVHRDNIAGEIEDKRTVQRIQQTAHKCFGNILDVLKVHVAGEQEIEPVAASAPMPHRVGPAGVDQGEIRFQPAAAHALDEKLGDGDFPAGAAGNVHQVDHEIADAVVQFISDDSLAGRVMLYYEGEEPRLLPVSESL